MLPGPEIDPEDDATIFYTVGHYRTLEGRTRHPAQYSATNLWSLGFASSRATARSATNLAADASGGTNGTSWIETLSLSVRLPCRVPLGSGRESGDRRQSGAVARDEVESSDHRFVQILRWVPSAPFERPVVPRR